VKEMAQQVMPARPAATDATGKSLGIAVFLLGVALLVVVFGLVYRELITVGDATTFSRLVTLPATLFFRGALLLVMGIVASTVANKGIALYQAARQPTEPPVPVPD